MAVRDVGERAPARRRLLRAGQHGHLDGGAGPGEQGQDVPRVLVGEDLGRRHERALIAVFDRDEQGQERDDRLPRADVPLQEARHRMRRAQVGADLAEHPLLGLGELERQELGELPAQRIRDVVVGAAGGPLDGVAPHRERQLHEEDLGEGQRALGGSLTRDQIGHRRVVRREVRLPERGQVREQAVLPAHVLRHGIHEVAVAQRRQDTVHHGAQGTRRKATELAVDRNDAPRVNPGRIGWVETLVIRILEDKLAPPPVDLGVAEHDDARLGHEHALEVRLVEPDALDRPAVVGK
jgi:hypothetical protein